jgi:hypothetical protein
MIQCQCGEKITQYRLTGTILSASEADRNEFLSHGSTFPLRIGSRFYALAMIICPICGAASFHDLSSPSISDMAELTKVNL